MKANILAVGYCLVCLAWSVFIGVVYGAVYGVLIGAILSMWIGKIMYYVIDDIRTKRRRGW